ncbi:enoyl-CoA hydratase/isomerase family protein [Solimonas sp. K1W22B-7]|nr:enoyl-CoA hydratase-related protein [Solimonas sp. K1W22B-7]AXQ31836.1 enoyl-CoA hydratase/isomerase family protein [Solimonas sp. K1W22B-7]
MNDLDDLLLDERAGVLTVTLNRPERRNALSATLINSLQQLATYARQNHGTLRAVVLRGAGGVFCAGGDIKDFRSVSQNGVSDARQIAAHNRTYGTLLSALDRLPQVVIAAVEGAAMGGGVGLASIADITLATADARFSLTETTLGLPPAQISPFVVARVGAHQARRLMLTAARFDAATAAALGLVDEVLADSIALDRAIERVLAQVLRCAPGANAMTKNLVHAAATTPLDELLDTAAAQFAAAMLGAEARDGVSAFISKGHPSWVPQDGAR